MSSARRQIVGAVGSLAVVVASATAVACGMASAESLNDNGTPGASDSGGFAPSDNAGTGKPGDLAPLDNGIILVHAAVVPSFRLCFNAQTDLFPQPDSKVMPEANVVGVEVGSAVRIDPLKGAPQEIFLYDEALIRPNFAPGADPPTCDRLLQSATTGPNAIPLGTIGDDLSTGVHMLVVTGCPKNTGVRTYSVAECGVGYDGAKGNLSIQHIKLPGVPRASTTAIPSQIVNLSPAIEAAKGAEAVTVSFGAVGPTADPKRVTLAQNPVLYGSPAPDAPVAVAYTPEDEAAYATSGFRVSVGTTTMLDQTLADVQKLSSPTDIPTTYYAQGSNYVLLLLGDPTPPYKDGGGVDTSDPRKNLHLLAVPVIQPKADGGAETDAGADGS